MNRSHGLTLIEVVIVLGLSTLLIGSVTWIMTRSYQSYRGTSAETDLQHLTRNSLDTIKLDIQNAHSVLGSYDSYSADSSTLILEIPRLDTQQKPIAAAYNYIIYRLSPSNSKQIERIEIIDTSEKMRLLDTKTSVLSFTLQDGAASPITVNYSDTKRVIVSLTSATFVNNRTIDLSLSTTAVLRNK